MRKHAIKVLIITIIIICLCIAMNSKIYAYSIENIFVDAQNFVKSGNDVSKTINTQALHDSSSFIYKLLLAIGIIVATVVGVVLGIQFMVASAEDKAKVKEALVAYAISCVVLFGAYNIWKSVVNIAQDIATIGCKHDAGFVSTGDGYHVCSLCGGAKEKHTWVDRTVAGRDSDEYHGCSKCPTAQKHTFVNNQCTICYHHK